MKKVITALLIAVFLFCMCSCGRIVSDKEVTDISEYGTVWEEISRPYGIPQKYSSSSELFPKTLQNLDVRKFASRHIQYQVLGDGWQVELKAAFDASDFENEVKRLSSLTENSPVHGASEYFGLPVYASVWNGELGSFEYAVIRESEKTISYIYLQGVEEKDDFSISSDCVPNNYAYPPKYAEKTFVISAYPAATSVSDKSE